jgi:rRNA processing protein Gar1
MASTGLDSYMADNAFRSRNPLFKVSETYQTEKEKRRLKRSKGKPKQFSRDDFYFDKDTMSCRCPAGKSMWLQSEQIITQGKAYTRFSGYLKHCRVCHLQQQCMRKPPKEIGRQVQFPDETNLVVSYSDKMKVKIDSPVGRRQYSKRLGAIEPVFGNITVNKSMNQFTLRGQEKVNSQWQMYCLVHNIEKLRNSLH